MDRTRISYTLANIAHDAEAQAQVAQGRDFIAEGAEGNRVAQAAIQRSLAAQANAVFTFGLFEGAIQHLHRNLALVIDAAWNGARRVAP